MTKKLHDNIKQEKTLNRIHKLTGHSQMSLSWFVWKSATPLAIHAFLPFPHGTGNVYMTESGVISPIFRQRLVAFYLFLPLSQWLLVYNATIVSHYKSDTSKGDTSFLPFSNSVWFWLNRKFSTEYGEIIISLHPISTKDNNMNDINRSLSIHQMNHS